MSQVYLMARRLNVFSAVVTSGTFLLFGKVGIILLQVLVLLDQLVYRVRYGHWQPADPAKR